MKGCLCLPKICPQSNGNIRAGVASSYDLVQKHINRKGGQRAAPQLKMLLFAVTGVLKIFL